MLTLTRFNQNLLGTFGVLHTEYKPLCVTLELPWRNNDRKISCIPTGLYTVNDYQSPSHGHVFKISDVPDRSNILIHTGNVRLDSQGCILVGKSFTSGGIAQSRLALADLLTMLPSEFELNIRWV